MRTPCRNIVYERTYARTCWRGIPGYLRRALQQDEYFADAGLSSQGCLSMAHALSGGVLPNRLHRLRTHKIHRRRSVETEAFYVVLAVREDKRREVLGIFNKPTKSALGWGEMLAELQERGVRKIGLVCADGLKGLEDVISAVFPGTPLQRCTTHLKRNLLSCVRNGDKGELAEDLRQVFLPYRGSQLYSREGLGTMAETLCEMGAGLPQFSTTGGGSGLQSPLHLSEL